MTLDLGVVLAVIAALGAAHAAIVVAILGSMILPNPVRQLQKRGPPESFGITPERTRIGDGSAAWYVPNDDATHAVLVCHGRSRSKSWMLPLIAALAPDYAVLAIDFPAHGERRYGTTTIGYREADTVDHGLDWLRRRGHQNVFVYGVSMGGAAALISVGRTYRAYVNAVVTDGTFDALTSVFDNVAARLPLPNYFSAIARAIARRALGFDLTEVRPIDGVGNIRAPLRFLHGDRDPLVPPRCANLLEDASQEGRAELYPGHHDDPTNEEMHAAVRAFFASVR